MTPKQIDIMHDARETVRNWNPRVDWYDLSLNYDETDQEVDQPTGWTALGRVGDPNDPDSKLTLTVKGYLLDSTKGVYRYVAHLGGEQGSASTLGLAVDRAIDMYLTQKAIRIFNETPLLHEIAKGENPNVDRLVQAVEFMVKKSVPAWMSRES